MSSIFDAIFTENLNHNQLNEKSTIYKNTVNLVKIKSNKKELCVAVVFTLKKLEK